ncbi:glucosaminidase domain-containing protein [Neobacillus kokaensis]|uniref:Mannosyl-glycoprotein endo-beta-N-acetylglucosamidase-like domain-containing protein n=1 Tax=Neobacillus kokaensis TaxID=2759023 RepID=A0ABQ3N0E2_9BACI|nr:glucosaminidase domain-containing protein [Neobacillus kokaensis]GHH97453.1 hypothetical protein AM1BK_09960 [Neobacillus kokaensis]
MSKVKKVSSYVLILLLFLQFIPNQSAVYAAETTGDQEVNAVLFADEIGGSINLYEQASSTSPIISTIKDDTAVSVIEKGQEYTLVQYLDEQRQEQLSGYVENDRVVDVSQAEEFRNSRTEEANDSNVEEPSLDTTETQSAEVSSENIQTEEVKDSETAVDSVKQAEESTSGETEVNTVTTRSLTVATAEESVVLRGIGLANPTIVYKMPSTSSQELKSYAQGTILKYETYSNDWYQCTVYMNGKAVTGYIKASDVENIVSSQHNLEGIALKNPTSIYSKAAKSSKVLKSYAQGTVLKYKPLTSEWYECTVYMNGKAVKGYIYKADVENLTSKQLDLQGVALKSPTKVYAKASTYSTTLKSYPIGTILKYKTLTSGWYEGKVYINGKAVSGYINVQDVENAVENPKSYTGVALKDPTSVYEIASTSSKAVKSYPLGSILKYQTFANGWYSATVYVNGKKKTVYIASSHVENSTTSPSTKQVWAKDDLKVYTYASKKAPALKSYPGGSELKVETFTSSWYKVKVYIKGTAHVGYISVSDITTRPYLDLDLRKPANITAQDIVDYFNRVKPSSPLKEYAQSFINVQNKYGVNALYLVAHAIWETGWGGSNLIKYKNNLYGYGAYDVCPFTCGYYFPTIENSIEAVAYMVRTNYLTPGGPYYYSEYGSTLRGMNVRYATDQNWKNGIANLMESMNPYDGKYYSTVSELPLNGSAPADLSRYIPEGLPYPTNIIIDFPNGITGKITENVSFRSLPYTSSSTYLDYLLAGSVITVEGFNTDVKENGEYPYDHRWYRILINGEAGWVYGDSIKIDNLLQVKGISTYLYIRKQPVDGDKIGSVPANSYLKAVLKDGKPVIQDGWYNVYLPNSSSTGWVSGDFINVIEK